VTSPAGADAAVPRRPRFDRRKLVACIEEQADFVARSLRNLGVDDAHVDLAVEKVFLLVLREEPTPDALANPAYLFRAAARVAAQARRRWPRRARSSASPREKLDAALESMPEELREVFVLGEIEKRELEWVAETLGQSKAWTQTRLHRAHRAFWTELDSSGTLPASSRPGHPRPEALEVLSTGRTTCASPRARERTLRAIEAVSSATVRGRLRLLGSRLSLVVWLLLALAIGLVIYEVLSLR
jgi:DNA-directed RNA polymerase specialized sigma24 family protein